MVAVSMSQGQEAPFKKVELDELKAIIAAEIRDSVGMPGTGSEVAEDRIRAMRMYFGRPFGNEQEGRSKVVITDVADTIHWIMPSLMRMFDTDTLFEYEAQDPRDEQAVAHAEQATKFINTRFWDDQDGFLLLWDWFFTALLENTGIVKADWDESIEPVYHNHEGLTREEYETLVGDPTKEINVVRLEERQIEHSIGGESKTLTVYDCTTIEIRRSGCIKIKGVPPEDFLITKRASRCDNATHFFGERKRMTASELIAAGFDPDVVKKLPAWDDRILSLEKIERERRNSQMLSFASRTDEAMREHWISDVWIRVDQDGDGFAELRNVLVAGDNAAEILSNDYADFNPFCTLTPVPIPFRFVGQGISELVADLQIIRSTIFRQMLDNMYLTNNNRMKAVEGQVELEDLLHPMPGGVVRVRAPEALQEIPTQQLSRDSYLLFDKLDEIRMIRTGVQPGGIGAGADAKNLQPTATGSNSAIAAANARVELIGRLFAKSGLKRLGQVLYRMYRERDNKGAVIKMGEEYVPIDPSSWPETTKVTAHIGLGVGAAAERIAMLMSVITLQKEALTMGAAFMVTPKHVYNATVELSKSMGYRGSDRFFGDPGNHSWPAPPPDPKILEHQRRTADDRARQMLDQLKHEADERRNDQLSDFRLEELRSKERMQQDELATRIEVARINADAREDRAEESRGEDPE